MKYKAVVFDLDGTLADSIEDLGDSMNHVLENEGLPIHTYQDYKYFVGKGVRNLVVASLPSDSREDHFIDHCLNRMITHYEMNCLNKTTLYKGIPGLLKKLYQKDIKMAVFSNKREELTKKVVDALIDEHYLEIVVGARAGLPKKPDPAGAILISDHLNLPPGEIIYMGDTNIDMLTANNAGMYAVGVTWGFRTRAELEDAGANLIIDQPEDLFQLLM